MIQLILVFMALLFVVKSMPKINNDILKTCRRCKLPFTDADNTRTSCKYHKGRWLGAENSKHLGGQSGIVTGLSFFWDCCDQEHIDGIGCMNGVHISYDDDIPKSFMLNVRE